MKTILKHKFDMMKDVVECPWCNKKEYYGHLTMRSGHSYCRDCIYDIWQEEGYKSAKEREEYEAYKHGRKPLYDRLSYWRRTEKDKIFPIYDNGINYYEDREDEYNV